LNLPDADLALGRLRNRIAAVLSQKTRYALKALLELAALPAGDRLSSAAISSRRTVPVKFLEAILVELKRGGVVRGHRGRSGGYQLARSADEISFGIVVRLMEGPLALIPCVSVTQYRRCEDCANVRTCELQKLFRVLRDSTATILDGWSLADARGKTGTSATRLGASAATKARRKRAAGHRR
jgi:Rrf2 family protein